MDSWCLNMFDHISNGDQMSQYSILSRFDEPVPIIASLSRSQLTGVNPSVIFCCCNPSTPLFGCMSYCHPPVSLNRFCHSPLNSLINEAELTLSQCFLFSAPLSFNSRDYLHENPRRSVVLEILNNHSTVKVTQITFLPHSDLELLSCNMIG